MALDVTVKITQAEVSGTLGFGYPLILISGAETETAYTECSSLDEIAEFFGEDSYAYDIATLIWKQKNAPATVAVYSAASDALTAIKAVDSYEWRQLIAVIGENDATTEAQIAAHVETTDDKMYFVTVSTVDELKALDGFDRTAAFYYDLVNENDELVEPYAVAAVVGEAAGREVGSFTYKNLIIKGLEALDLSDTTVDNIHDAGGFTLLLKAGEIVTSEGKVTSGEYIDVIDSKDWIIQQIAYQSQQLLNSSDKLPYTDAGIAALESVTVNVLQTAFSNGMIATDDDGVSALYTVNFKSRSEMSTADRQSRIYNGGNFTFALAGAIHYAEIKGQLEI